MLLAPLGGAAFLALSSAARGYEGETPLMLFTAAALSVTFSRIIFARHIKRIVDLARSGKPVEKLTAKQQVILILTILAIMMSMAVLL